MHINDVVKLPLIGHNDHGASVCSESRDRDPMDVVAEQSSISSRSLQASEVALALRGVKSRACDLSRCSGVCSVLGFENEHRG